MHGQTNIKSAAFIYKVADLKTHAVCSSETSVPLRHIAAYLPQHTSRSRNYLSVL